MKRRRLLIAFLVVVLGCNEETKEVERVLANFKIQFSGTDYEAEPIIRNLMGERCEISFIIRSYELDDDLSEVDIILARSNGPWWVVHFWIPEDMDQVKLAKRLEYVENVATVRIGD